MKKFIVLSLLISVSMVSIHAQTTESNKLPLDSTVRIGRLSNGMTYYIKHNENPKQRADFFITHNVGSLQENDDQLGLAHFLEHMAFNGSKHFPNKGMLNYLASIGVRFGYNVNAFTSKDRTVYNVSDVPMIRESIIDSALLVLHDWSGYLLCEPDEIEAERGVIREEWRKGYDSRARMMLKQAQYEYLGSQYAKRDVIGDPKIIDNFERQTLIDFYHKWYRPDLQAVIIVGDVDVDQIENKIKTLFSSIPKAVNPAPKQTYTIPESKEPIIATITDPEASAYSVKLIYRQPFPSAAQRETVQNLKYEIARDILLTAIKTRFTDAEKNPEAKFKRVIPVSGALSTCRYTYMLTSIPKNNNLADATEGMLTEIERIRQHGLNQSEFKAAKAKVMRDRQLDAQKTRQSNNTTLANIYATHFTQGLPYMNADAQLKITQQLIEQTMLRDIKSYMDQLLPRDEMLILYATPEDKTSIIPSEQKVRELIATIENTKLESVNQSNTELEPIFTAQLSGGKVSKQKAIEQYDAVEWTLSNGAKVVWKSLDQTIGNQDIGMFAYNNGGYLREDISTIPTLRILQNYVRTMGIKGYTKDEIKGRLYDNDASITANINKQSSSITGSSSVEDFELMLQLTYLQITEPNLNKGAVSKYTNPLRTKLLSARSTNDIFTDSVEKLLYNHHQWTQRPTIKTIDEITPELLREIYDRQFGNAADFTFIFAGKLSAEQAKPLIEKYIGSLKGGKKSKLPKSTFELAKGTTDFKYEGEKAMAPKAVIERHYHGDFEYSPDQYAALKYMDYILGSRYMKSVREEKGGTYYIGVKDEVSSIPQGYCDILINFETQPSMADMLLEEVQKGIEDLAQSGPTTQEVNEAMLYFRKVNNERKEDNTKTPKYWTSKMHNYYLSGVDTCSDDQTIVEKVTQKDIQALCQSLLKQGNRFTSILIQ